MYNKLQGFRGYCIIIVFCTAKLSFSFTSIEPDCDVFCSGKILHYVQTSRIFNDSKYFVDTKLKFPPDNVTKNFLQLLNDTKNEPNDAQLSQFVMRNFEPPGVGINMWEPEDWQERPSYINEIQDIRFKKWLLELNDIWKILGRKLSQDILINENLYSQIFVPYPFIVPGGRFREFYYWDSYWLIDGLLLSEMKISAKYMINNFLYLIEKYGYVPNGPRKYFLGRSQPPFLIQMVNLYYEATKDISFIKKNILTLEKEFNFWLKNRSVFIKKDRLQYQVFLYKVDSVKPRAEAYYEDMNLANMVNNSQKAFLYSSIKSAAESGWDFSSRWFIAEGKHSNYIFDINTMHIIPVCLNSIMGINAHILSKFFKFVGDKSKFIKYSEISININKTLSRIFWNDDEGIWLDYNLITGKHLPGFYLSSFMPLWSDLYGIEYEKEYIIKRVLEYIKKINITSYSGGLPTSLVNSTQQWDYPNGWAPLQYFLILGLQKAGSYNTEAKELAFEIAKKWILNCYTTFYNSVPPAMFEKYDVTKFGSPGGGGEYEIQKGFGWSNGVVMRLAKIYGNQIMISEAGSMDVITLILGLSLFIIAVSAAISYRPVYKTLCLSIGKHLNKQVVYMPIKHNNKTTPEVYL